MTKIKLEINLFSVSFTSFVLPKALLTKICSENVLLTFPLSCKNFIFLNVKNIQYYKNVLRTFFFFSFLVRDFLCRLVIAIIDYDNEKYIYFFFLLNSFWGSRLIQTDTLTGKVNE